jgi:K+ transporter
MLILIFFAGEVVMITVAFLIVLFSLQRFGTSKVGLAVGPTLFIWFCCLSGIGIYNIMTYGSEVLRAFNPIYIYYYFERNPPQAWMSLGGCLLCATGIYFDCTVNIIFDSCF